MKEPKDIPNFDKLCEMLKYWDEHPEEDSFAFTMQSEEGYLEWLEWMETNEPEKLP